MSKIPRKLNEGPLDFMRGAGAEIGNKVANSAPVQAGRQASAMADLEKAIAQLAAALAYVDKVAPEAEVSGDQQQSQGQQQPQQGQQQPQQGQGNPFTAAQKPRMVMKGGMQQYQFNSFLQAVHGKQIDEGVWDFVKGAGAAAGQGIKDKINQYAAKPSILKDIYAAGQNASAAGNANKAATQQSQQLEKARAQTQTLLSTVLKLAQVFGDQAPQALNQAIRKAGGPMATRIAGLVAKNAAKRGIQ